MALVWTGRRSVARCASARYHGRMTNPVVLKHTMPVVLLTIAQAIALPSVAAGLLAFERWYFGAQFHQSFVLMLVFVLVLGAVLLQPERGLMPQLIGGRREL